MKNTDFMRQAIQIAYDNTINNNGGPFGAVVVKNGAIIAKGVNQVSGTNDPTAHAEIQAIRAACLSLGNFQLTDCEIYSSCEPCPMCIGAIYWARPKAVYFACSKEEAASIGFDDHFIYKEIATPINQRKIQMEKLIVSQYDLPFNIWKDSKEKKEY